MAACGNFGMPGNLCPQRDAAEALNGLLGTKELTAALAVLQDSIDYHFDFREEWCFLGGIESSYIESVMPCYAYALHLPR
jgi:hypothetical protein